MIRQARVSTSAFEGALEDLVSVLRSEKAAILEVSLETLCRQVLDQLPELDLEAAGTALALAALLVRMKTKAILRREGIDDAVAERELEAELADDLAACRELVKKLRETRAVEIPRRFVAPLRSSALSPQGGGGIPSSGAETFTIDELEAEILGMEKVLAGEAALQPDPYPIAAMREELLAKINGGRIAFPDLWRDEEHRHQVAIFLTVLEEVRAQSVRAEQEQYAAPIWLSARARA